MAEQFFILKASAVMNAPTCATLQNAVDGAQQRSSVDGEDRVVVVIAFEANANASPQSAGEA